MKSLKFSMIALLAFAAIGIMTTSSSCTKEYAAPVVTLSSDSFTGKIGEVASTTVDATIEAEYKELKITKYIGTDVDASYGTDGTMTVTASLPYTLDYTLAEEGAETPIRFQFQVYDKEDQVGEANFVVTTELTYDYVLTAFNWRWDTKVGKVFEADPVTDLIEDCEKDNVFIFNADGSMSIDYGALTGEGGGTCDFDGLNPYVFWELNADNTVLTLTKDNAFDPGNYTYEVYNIVSFSLTDFEATSTVDLTAFGGVEYDWTFTFKAEPK